MGLSSTETMGLSSIETIISMRPLCICMYGTGCVRNRNCFYGTWKQKQRPSVFEQTPQREAETALCLLSTGYNKHKMNTSSLSLDKFICGYLYLVFRLDANWSLCLIMFPRRLDMRARTVGFLCESNEVIAESPVNQWQHVLYRSDNTSDTSHDITI